MKFESHVHAWIDACWLTWAGELPRIPDDTAALVAYYHWVEGDDK